MESRSWIARRANLTSYAILLAHVRKDFARRLGSTFGNIFQPLTQALFGIGQRSEIQAAFGMQPLLAQ